MPAYCGDVNPASHRYGSVEAGLWSLSRRYKREVATRRTIGRLFDAMSACSRFHTRLNAIGWPWSGGAVSSVEWASLLDIHPNAQPGRVVQQHRNGYRVAFSTDGIEVITAPVAWQRSDFPAQLRAAVGDWVLVEAGQIVALLPRHRVLKRAVTGQPFEQQIIASNIDTALILCGLNQAFSLRRIIGYCLMASSGGVEPVVVLTKADQYEQVQERVEYIQEALGKTRVIVLDPRRQESLTALTPWLRSGTTLVIVGPSGAGKSTLTNTLLGYPATLTGAVRPQDGSGRHTTSQRTLWSLPAGACVIDTPGMRELKPTGEELLETEFADIIAYAHQCRFRDCQHQHEPGCAVQSAVRLGQLSSHRVQHFRIFGQEIAQRGQKAGKPQRTKRGRRTRLD